MNEHKFLLTKRLQTKKIPDNPILYLQKFSIKNIFRFIVTHPDMDHLDGIKDLFNNFSISNFWDTDNKKRFQIKPDQVVIIWKTGSTINN